MSTLAQFASVLEEAQTVASGLEDQWRAKLSQLASFVEKQDPAELIGQALNTVLDAVSTSLGQLGSKLDLDFASLATSRVPALLASLPNVGGYEALRAAAADIQRASAATAEGLARDLLAPFAAAFGQPGSSQRTALDQAFHPAMPVDEAQFLQSLSRAVFGLDPDAVGSLISSEPFAPLTPLAALASPAAALVTASARLDSAASAFDPAAMAAFEKILANLDAVESAARALRDGLTDADTITRDVQWGSAFAGVRAALRSVAAQPAWSFGEAAARLAEGAGRWQRSGAAIAVAMGDRLRAIKSAVDAITAVLAGLEAAAAVPQKLAGLAQTQAAITRRIEDAVTFVESGSSGLSSALDPEALGAAISSAIAPLSRVVASFDDAVGRVEAQVLELERALREKIDELTEPLKALDDLSFKPAADVVIGELGQLEAKLRGIKPNALSTAEKLAIGAALVLLRSLNLEEKLTELVQSPFNQASEAVTKLLESVAKTVRAAFDKVTSLQDDALAAPLAQLAKARGVVEQLDARVPLAGVYDWLRDLTAELEDLVDSLSAAAAIDLNAPAFDATGAQPIFDELVAVSRLDFPATARELAAAALRRLAQGDSLPPWLSAALPPILFPEPGGDVQRQAELLAPLQRAEPIRQLDALFDDALKRSEALSPPAVQASIEKLRTQAAASLAGADSAAILAQAGDAVAAARALVARISAQAAAFSTSSAAATGKLSSKAAEVSARFQAVLVTAGDLAAAGAGLPAALDAARKEWAASGAQAEYAALSARIQRASAGGTLRERLEPLRPSSAIVATLAQIAAGAPAETAQALDETAAALREAWSGFGRRLALLDPAKLSADLAKACDPEALDPSRVADSCVDLLISLKSTLRRSLDAIVRGINDGLDTLYELLGGVFDRLRDFITRMVGAVWDIVRIIEDLVLNRILGRLQTMVTNLQASFAAELERVRKEFDGMLSAIPL